MRAKKTIIRIRKDFSGWIIQKHGSTTRLYIANLCRAIRKVSTLIEDRENVIGINFDIIREKAKRTIIRIKSDTNQWWSIRKHGSRGSTIMQKGLANAIRKVSALIDDRENVTAINVEVIRKP